jgi:acetoin utilization protein AcuB
MPAITQLMSPNPVSVAPDDTLLVVKEIFDKVKFHHILVVEHNVLLGVISDRDLFKALSPNLGTAAETTKDLATLKKRVHQVMHRKPVALVATAEVMDAVRVFNHDNVSCIPIVDQQQRPLGIVSWRDIMRALEKKEPKPQ